MAWGDQLGKGGRVVGVGVSLPPSQVPQKRSILYDDWRDGFQPFEIPERLVIGASPKALDVEASTANALRRAPGILEVEDVSPRSLAWLFEHAALGFASKLVAIDPPYIGEKYTGDFVFTDEGIVPTGDLGWNVCNILGILLFSNGVNATYLRDWETGAITDISAEIVAETFANAFGRTFAGAVTDSGTLYSLQVNWNAANADPADWTGVGSGNLPLASNQQDADRIVALRALGFDVLAAVCRKNIWLGYPTGDSDQPADFRLRFPGLGSVSERTTVVTPAGCVTLTDRGVVLFDINEYKIISAAVNNRLLPLDYGLLSQYYAIYNAPKRRYQLYTPTGAWIFELEELTHPARWYKRSYVGSSAAMFTEQIGNYTWESVPGLWNEQTKTWAEMAVSEQNVESNVYNGQESLLGSESRDVTQYFDADQTAYWEFKQSAERASDYQTTEAVELEYESRAEAEISLAMIDADGAVVGTITRTLPNSGGERINRMLWFIITGTGLTLRLTFTSGNPEIFRVRHVISQSAPATQAL